MRQTELAMEGRAASSKETNFLLLGSAILSLVRSSTKEKPYPFSDRLTLILIVSSKYQSNNELQFSRTVWDVDNIVARSSKARHRGHSQLRLSSVRVNINWKIIPSCFRLQTLMHSSHVRQCRTIWWAAAPANREYNGLTQFSWNTEDRCLLCLTW